MPEILEVATRSFLANKWQSVHGEGPTTGKARHYGGVQLYPTLYGSMDVAHQVSLCLGFTSSGSKSGPSGWEG